MRLSNPFKKNFANTKTLLHPLKGLKIIVVLTQIHVPETELAQSRRRRRLRLAMQPVEGDLIRSVRKPDRCGSREQIFRRGVFVAGKLGTHAFDGLTITLRPALGRSELCHSA